MLKKKFRGNDRVVEEKSTQRADYWKRRPSEMRGYQKTYYITDTDGSYIRIDYNVKDRKLRVYVEDASEGGISYYSVIEQGKIITEKNLATGRATSLSQKFTDRAKLFVTIPHREVLQLFGEHFGVAEALKEKRDAFKKMKLETTRKRYFRDDNRGPLFGSYHHSKGFRLIDLIDMLVGAAIGGSIFYFLQSYVLAGVFFAFFGILVGITDLFLREREPIFTKIILFVVSGIGFYVYGRYFLDL